MDTFSIRDLRERSADLVRELESGALALITKHGRPVGVTVPMDDTLLREGLPLALAVALVRSDSASIGLAARVAGLSYVEFVEHLSRIGIPVADYGGDQLERELDTLG